MKPHRIGILGTAHPHAGLYAELLQTEYASRAALSCVFDQNSKRAHSFAEEFGVEGYSNLNKFLNSGITTAIVCAETMKRSSLIMQAARTHVNILSEPPIACTLSDAKRVVGTTSRSHINMQLALPWRSASVCRQLRLWLRQELIGSLLGINLCCRSAMPEDWRKAKQLSGGGAAMENAYPALDMVRWLTGEEPHRLFMVADTVFSRGQLEDQALIMLSLGERGIPVFIDASWLPDGNRRSDEQEFILEVTGSNGAARLNLYADKVTTELTDGTVQRSMVGIDSQRLLSNVLRDYLNSVENHGAALATVEDGIQCLDLLQLAYKSARYKKTMPHKPSPATASA